jgi:tRNA pseudouridine65 synthase
MPPAAQSPAPGHPAWEPSAAPLGRGVDPLHCDPNGLVALAKPAGVLSHPNEAGERSRALLDAAYHVDGEYFEWTPPGAAPARLYLLNRLDSGTSGVILLATTELLARAIRALFRQKNVHKIYQALVFGVPSQGRQIWRDRLAVQKQGGQIRTGTGGNIPAEAQMSVVRQNREVSPPVALIQLEPRTGRSHQLRVQCAQRQLPIVGDATYGDFRLNRDFAKRTGQKRLFLHSLATTFEYEFAGRRHAFSARAPLPAEFAAALGSRAPLDRG